ncbi:MAG: T9SS type A sorting domain-containing protein [Chitinophagales bacterium]|nr:T9SS type A sorting domain-containing protein [Chitinophagales bacterium]
MKKLFVVALAGSMVAYGANVAAQANRICGNEIIQQEINNDAYLKTYFENYYKQYDAENKAMAEEASSAESKSTASYPAILIPVVFHVVLNKAQFGQILDTPGLLDRINSQLLAMNEDYTMTNNDVAAVPAGFKSLVGNANIHFQLARRDAQGKAKLGVVYSMQNTSFTGYNVYDHTVKRSVLGGSDPWDYTKYLNVWITSINPPTSGGQVLGYAFNSVYAQTTYGDPALAGIVVHYLAFGRKTLLSQNFYSPSTEKGRTLTHELGHFFNIWHIWGKSTPAGVKNCNDDDGITDTPLQEESNSSCPIGIKANCTQASDPNGEMYMNYMDYSSDVCTKMFSIGQVQRMRFELDDPNGQVHSLSQHPELASWPTDVSPMEYNNKVEVGPNPSTGKFNVFFYDKYNKLNNIAIVNNVGQQVKEIPVTDQQQLNYGIDITGVPEGIYIVQLHFDEGTIFRKVVVK